jgi:TPR repeat protein
MNEGIFWQLITESKLAADGDANTQVANLEAVLKLLPEADIVEFDRLLHGHLNRSYTRDLWAAAYIINGGCSDDGFDYFRAWLVAQGKDVFENALVNPESLIDVAQPNAELETLMYAPIKAYEARTETKFPYSTREVPQLTGDEWEETPECLQKKFPRLFEKFWNAANSTNGDAEKEIDLGAAFAALQELVGGLGGGKDPSDPESLYTQAVFLAMDESPENLQKSAEILTRAADQGHAGAQYLVGACLQEGRGVAQDYQAAAKYYRLAADQDNADACGSLGSLYQDGLGVAPDIAAAVKWYRQGAEAGSADAAASLGVLYADGLGVEKNAKESIKWLRRAAQDGHEVAANNLGIAYGNGLGVKLDNAEAVKWFTKAAESGYSDAQYNLGVLVEFGRGTDCDPVKAAELYRAAADQGNAKAQSNLGMLYAKGKGVEQDYAKAAELYRQAADQGNLVALSNLAVLYQNGRGVPQDLVEAVRLYRQAADAGVSAGQYNLGTMYERGLGVAPDFSEALRWYRLAADQGVAAAQNNIGDFYETGRAVKQNFKQAAEWYRKAADQGISVSQLSLGDFYRKGQGVKQDLREAEKWYLQAAAQGLDAAVQRLREMYESGELLQPAKAKPKNSRSKGTAKKKPVAVVTNKKKAKDPRQSPTAKIVAQRAICLRSLVRRCQIEAGLIASKKIKSAKTKLNLQALADEAKQINHWLKDEELWTSLSDHEAGSLRKKPGTWSVRELTDGGWRTEAFGVIAWALGLTARIAPYDQQQSEGAFLKKIPLQQRAKKFIRSAKLRPEAKILKAREIAENWLWRARTTIVQKNPKKYPPPSGWTYDKIIKAAALHWQKQKLFKAIKGDYPAFGKPYAKLTKREWETCNSIAKERLYGFNWLCGYAADWDQVPTGT